MLESSETGTTRDAPASPDADVRQVEAVLTRLYERVGAKRMWEWMREPNQALYGVTPPRTLVGHGLRRVPAHRRDSPDTHNGHPDMSYRPGVLRAPGFRPGPSGWGRERRAVPIVRTTTPRAAD
jgi:hypothetical protein